MVLFTRVSFKVYNRSFHFLGISRTCFHYIVDKLYFNY